MARTLVKNASKPNPPNLLINGAMDFWQRGVGPLDTSINRLYSTVDRFIIGASGGSGGQIQSRSTVVPNTQFKYSVQQVENGDQSGNNLLAFQKIEAALIRPYIGRQVTLSMWVQFVTVLPSAPELRVYTPVSVTEDLWQSDPLTDTQATNKVITGLTLGSWSRVSFTFTVPANAGFGLMVSLASGSYNGQPTMRHTGWMLTEGPTAPEIFYRAGDSLETELAMCQRYYEKTYNIEVDPGTSTNIGRFVRADNAQNATTLGGHTHDFKVAKRATPTITIYPSDGSPTGSFNYGTGGTEAVATVFETSTRGFGLFTSAAAGLTTGNAIPTLGHWTASAEL